MNERMNELSLTLFQLLIIPSTDVSDTASVSSRFSKFRPD